MLLLLIILITLLVFLLFLCSSSLILYYLNMAWLCRVTVFWLFWNLSAEKCTPTETNSVMDETFEFFFSTERNVLSAEPQKKTKTKTKPVFSLGEPLLHLLLILLKRRRCTDEREKFYICNRGDCFVCTTWVLKSFRLFRNQNPKLVTYLPAHLQRYVFDFEKKKKNLTKEIRIFKWMSSIPTGGKHICTVQNQKTTLRKKDLKLSASFPIHCRSTVFYQQVTFLFLLLLLPSLPGFFFTFNFYGFIWFHCGAIVPTWSITKKYLKWF